LSERRNLISWNSEMWPEFTPIVFAHRGDSAHAPENTISAFTMAAEKGATAIELDVNLSADKQVVVIHDSSVERTTNGSGKVRSMPYGVLKELDAGEKFSGQYRGEHIPTLNEVFETLGKRIFINVELKDFVAPDDELVPRVVALVKEFGLQNSVMFSSFFPSNLLRAKKLLPEVPCGLLALGDILGWQARTFGYRRKEYAAFHPNLKNVTFGLVNRVHAAGKRVHVYTVNDVEDIKRLVGIGVDGIFTDDPGQALKVLGKSS
jgi:glycerophosphoryl diester phosphodiesterase